MTREELLDHHLRQAGADLGLARGALRRAIPHANGYGQALQTIVRTLEAMEKFLPLVAKVGEARPDEILPPPWSSER